MKLLWEDMKEEKNSSWGAVEVEWLREMKRLNINDKNRKILKTKKTLKLESTKQHMSSPERYTMVSIFL